MDHEIDAITLRRTELEGKDPFKEYLDFMRDKSLVICENENAAAVATAIETTVRENTRLADIMDSFCECKSLQGLCGGQRCISGGLRRQRHS
jgi:hypothetical protein